MSKSTLVLIIILFLLTLGLLVVALNKSFYNSTNPNKSLIPTVSIASPLIPDTSLLFGKLSTAYPIELGNNSLPVHSLPIFIKTEENKVIAVQLELSFDPSVLTNVSMTPSTFFKNPNVVINKVNMDTGRIYYALNKTVSEGARMGEGTIATLTFESSISSVSSVITFLPRTFVTAEGLDSSALKSTNSADLKFNN